ncbi:MAG: STAS domain-containing protein [Clostridia bacterium]|nr:STAS domain-containing protein [Clostridia bacterium]
MEINKSVKDNELVIALEGRLDTNTASDLENEVQNIDGIKKLTFDFEKLEYISSAGLRILLSCQKKMSLQGVMIIKNVNDSIKEVFDITGFSDILTVE